MTLPYPSIPDLVTIRDQWQSRLAACEQYPLIWGSEYAANEAGYNAACNDLQAASAAVGGDVTCGGINPNLYKSYFDACAKASVDANPALTQQQVWAKVQAGTYP